MNGGYKILYLKKDGIVISYVVYTHCGKYSYDSGNRDDYYVIFYYTYPEYRGNRYADKLMKMLFSLIDDRGNFYECIADKNLPSIGAANKIGFKKVGCVKKTGYLHIPVLSDAGNWGLYKFER